MAAAYLAEADAALVGHPDVRYAGFIHDAKKEFAEANLTLAFVGGNPIPTADELGVEVQAYLNGMSEAASELRRQTLDCLRRDDNEEAERLLAVMDDVYGVLITIDFPDALTGGLRRSTDALRAVLERTRATSPLRSSPRGPSGGRRRGDVGVDLTSSDLPRSDDAGSLALPSGV